MHESLRDNLYFDIIVNLIIEIINPCICRQN